MQSAAGGDLSAWRSLHFALAPSLPEAREAFLAGSSYEALHVQMKTLEEDLETEYNFA